MAASIVAPVAGRLALVVGSECAALNPLGFPAELAGGLLTALTAAGGWQPITGGPVLDPDVDGLHDAVLAAFVRAHTERATLLVAFVGHGVSTGPQDFFPAGP